MPKKVNSLTVFVASPGGLEEERKQFFDVLSRFNVDDGRQQGIMFSPEGHELAFAGAGRPQGIINQQVRESDYSLVVFWDKWGAPPSSTGDYTSGTEEEFYVGLECLRDAEKPMRNIAVFFKGTPDRQLSDPGPQLQKILDFKSKLEEEKIVLYRNFDTIEGGLFIRVLRRCGKTLAREPR